MSDLGVLLDPSGRPVLPGSSLKGRLRSTCESLAHALGLTACLLDTRASDVLCVSDVDEFKKLSEAYQKEVGKGPEEQLAWIAKHTCDVCKLFGSPVRAARLRCADGRLQVPANPVIQVRDGVVLDRDSHTAVDGLKYDYEVVPAGTSFAVRFDLDNPEAHDEALLGIALFEWAAGSSLGGFTSRGLGRFHLEDFQVQGVDLSDPKERVHYLTTPDPEKRLFSRDDWQTYFTEKIKRHVEAQS
jgi:CRISPR-associated RAMP protein (TIGR02581 family)